jgi:hypothetical protein
MNPKLYSPFITVQESKSEVEPSLPPEITHIAVTKENTRFIFIENIAKNMTKAVVGSVARAILDLLLEA